VSEEPIDAARRVAAETRARLRGSMTREYASWARSQTQERGQRSFESTRKIDAGERRSSVEVHEMLRARLVDELTRAGRLDATDAEIVEVVEGFVARVLSEEDVALNEREPSILVSGGTGSGKTTLLNALSSFITPDERDRHHRGRGRAELQQPHVVRLETRPAQHRGRGRGHHARPRQEQPAHAARPHHRAARSAAARRSTCSRR
jgi:ATPase subunit of ABC transporter with duplicated ATPase domains